MENRRIIRIAMRLTESIIEILKEEFGDDEKKAKVKNAGKHKKMVKGNS